MCCSACWVMSQDRLRERTGADSSAYQANTFSPLRTLPSHISQRYPYVSTEVLCSEIWSIVETCLNNTDQLLVPFWETVLDRTPEDMKTRMTMASQFAKINAVFLSKKPAEVTAAFLRHPVADSETRCRCSNSSEHSEISSIEYSNTLRCLLFPISLCG